MQLVIIFLCGGWGKVHSILSGLVIHNLEDACKLSESLSRSSSWIHSVLRFSFSLAPRWLILLHFLLGIFKHWSYPVLPAVAAWGIYLEPYSPNSLLPHLSRSLNPSSGFPGCLSQLFTHMLPLPPPHCLNPLNHKSSDVTVFSYSPQSIFSLFPLLFSFQ